MWTGRGLPCLIALMATAVTSCGGEADLVQAGSLDAASAHGVTDLTPPQGGPRTTLYELSTPSCETCSVRLNAIAVLGKVDDAILFRDIPIVERDSRGHFHATVPLALGHELISYDADGQIIGTVGRFGDGPGEFRSVRDIMIGPGDSLLVLHGRTVSIFDQAGRFARSVRLDSRVHRPNGFVLAAGDALVLNHEFTRTAAGLGPFKEYDHAGRVRREFGPTGLLARYTVGLLTLGARTGAGAAGSVWVQPEPGYRLERVGPDGEVKRIIGVRTPEDWRLPVYMSDDDVPEGFRRIDISTPANSSPPHARDPNVPRATERRPTSPPPGRIEAMHQVGADLLLVLVHVAALDWQNARVRLDNPLQSIPDPGYSQQLYDTMIDVNEISTGSLLSRTRVRGTLYLTRDGTAYRPVVDERGVITVRMFEIEMVGRPERK